MYFPPGFALPVASSTSGDVITVTWQGPNGGSSTLYLPLAISAFFACPLAPMKVTAPDGRGLFSNVTEPETVPPHSGLPQPAAATNAHSRQATTAAQMSLFSIALDLHPAARMGRGEFRGTGHQSFARISPPRGVRATHQVVPLTPLLTARTLPSASPTCIPPDQEA